MAKRKWSADEINEWRETHNSYFIYYNEKDANLFVPRADNFSMWSITGMTLNWAHPIAQIFLFVLITLIILPLILRII